MVAKTHGKSHQKIHRIWQNMITRCTNPNSDKFKWYGARGITVCVKWLRFEGFYEDMGEVPDGKTLDRKDNSLGYSKENCQWVDMVTQCNNRRTNRIIVIDGIEKTVAEWLREPGAIQGGAIYSRLDNGWDPKAALFTPKRSR